MPTYEYACRSCEREWEIDFPQSMSVRKSFCPACGTEAEQVIRTAPAIATGDRAGTQWSEKILQSEFEARERTRVKQIDWKDYAHTPALSPTATREIPAGELLGMAQESTGAAAREAEALGKSVPVTPTAFDVPKSMPRQVVAEYKGQP